MDTIFKALNDPTRRALLDNLREKDGQSLQDLAAQLDMSRFGVMKHLKILEDASLVVTHKTGRFKYHYLNAVPLQEVIDRWIEPLLAKQSARLVIDLKSDLEGTRKMPLDTEKPDLVLSTYIKTTQDTLWEALTKGDIIEKYHFACEKVKGDYAEGQSVEYIAGDGSLMLTNRVISVTPKTRIEMEFLPSWASGPETASRCVYLVEPAGDQMRLTVQHFGLPPEHAGINDGWTRYLSGLKTWIETGESVHFAMETETA